MEFFKRTFIGALFIYLLVDFLKILEEIINNLDKYRDANPDGIIRLGLPYILVFIFFILLLSLNLLVCLGFIIYWIYSILKVFNMRNALKILK
jgi:hypothetical protein